VNVKEAWASARQAPVRAGGAKLSMLRRGRHPMECWRGTAWNHDPTWRGIRTSRANQLWVADFTHLATWACFVYVAFGIDVFARRIVGWRVARTMSTTLVLDALD